VWKHVKYDRVGRAGVSGPEDLKAKALAVLHRLQKLPDLVRSFFWDPNLGLGTGRLGRARPMMRTSAYKAVSGACCNLADC
jgi:hypothetical protein